MNVLLDTHIYLWWLDDHPSLCLKTRNIIANGENKVFVSTVSLWEIYIKKAIGKLDIPENFKEVIKKEPIQHLVLKPEHIFAIENLPMLHRDPFDRILIAQANYEHFTLITNDKHFSSYNVNLLLNKDYCG